MPVSRMRTAPRCAWLVALCLVKSAGGLFLLGSAVSAPSKYTQRFDAMVDDFRKHRPQEIDLVDDPRFRELLHSCRSALDDTKVVLAFQVLYEDLAPVRIGGDLIFRKLDRAVQDVRGSESKAPSTRAIVQDAAAAALVEEKRLAYDASTKEYLAALAWPQPIVDEFVARVAAEVERETLALAAARRVFEAVDADGSGALGKSELVEFGDVIRSFGQCKDCTCDKVRSCAAVDRLMAEVEQEDELSFSDFMVGFARAFSADDVRRTEILRGGDMSDEIVNELLSRGRSTIPFAAPSPRASKHRLRFDSMVDEFVTWCAYGNREGPFPPATRRLFRGDDPAVVESAQKKNARLAIVLDGCFAGAKNPSVVSALRVLYEDYRALRLVGDLIFKLMRSLVGQPTKNVLD